MATLVDQDKWHEKAADKHRQLEILRMFCGAQGFCGLSSREGEPYDATIIQPPKMIAYAEIKHRNHEFGTYPDYTIDKKKVDAIFARAEQRKLAVFLIVSFNGEIFYCHLNPGHCMKTTMQKRRDRDELADEVCHIPISNFKKISVAYNIFPK